MKKTFDFDPKCLELAEHFIDDDDQHKWTSEDKFELKIELAELIQSTVEDFLWGPVE